MTNLDFHPLGSFFDPSPDWRWHGLGMLQRELSMSARVHVWHPLLLRVPKENFRRVHDHRFDLTSIVVYGTVTDVRYHVDRADEDVANTKMWAITHAKMQTGDDVGFIDFVKATPSNQRTVYKAGQHYHIPRRAFHESVPTDLAITIVTRSNFLPETESARVLGDHAHSAIAGAHSPIARDDELVAEVLNRARLALKQR